MSQQLPEIKLKELSPLLKVIFTLFLVAMGAAYLVSMFNLYLTYHLTDGEPGLTLDDLRRSFYGDRNRTMLSAKIDGGSMEQYLATPGQKETILTWLQDGASETGYEETVRPILEDRCTTCHQPGRLMAKRPLTSYEQVQSVTVVDRGEPIGLWARVAHTHLMSLGVVFFCLAIIFSFCGVGQKMKIFFMPMPFVALFVDFGARALIKYVPAFVYVMAATGVLMGISMFVLTVGPLWDMWLRKRR